MKGLENGPSSKGNQQPAESQHPAAGAGAAEHSSLPWYFPLEEARAPLGHTVEWTFRGLLIFALLEYDV